MAVAPVDIPGYAYVQKSSSDSSLVSGNSMYSLEGACYVIYTDADCTTIATDSDGNEVYLYCDESGTTDVVELDAGTYYVKEVINGSGYALDDTVYEFTVTSNETTKVAVTDVPVSGEVTLVQKQDATGSETAQGDATLAGAQYTVVYYEGYYDTPDELDDVTSTRTWVFETDETGEIHLDSDAADYLVSGDSLYYDEDGNVAFLLGTYVIHETKASDGYELSGQTYVAQVWQSYDTLSAYSKITYPEESDDSEIDDAEPKLYAGIKVGKIDHDSDTNVAQGDATLAGAVFTIWLSEDSAEGIRVLATTEGIDTETGTLVYDSDGTAYYEYEPGAVVMYVTTDEDGYASTSADALPTEAAYVIRETTAPTGYLLNEDWSLTVTLSDGQAGTLADYSDIDPVDDPPITASVAIAKVDVELDQTAQGDATLAGAEVTLCYISGTDYEGAEGTTGNAIYVDGSWYASGATWTLTTDEHGYITTPHLPYGTYALWESSPSVGYLLNEDWYVVFTIDETTVTEDGTVIDLTEDKDYVLSEEPIRGGVSVQKLDDGTLDATAQGDATLAGAEIAVTNASDGPVVVYITYDGETVDHGDNVILNTSGKTLQTNSDGNTYYEYAVGEVVLTLVTDEDGFATTSADALPYGTYTLTEVTPSTGYLLNTEWSATIEVRTDGTIYDAGSYSSTRDLEEEVIRGGVTLRKVDAESGLSSAQGAATLEGAEIEVTNASEAAIVMYVTYDGETVDYGELVTLETAGKTLHTNEAGDTYYVYEVGEVVLTLTTDEDGVAGCGAVLPYGTYVATEAAAPTGYLLNSDWSVTFEVREDGAIVDLTGDEGTSTDVDAEASSYVVADQVVRGDLAFSKKVEGTSERLSYAVFALTSTTTGETHIVVCDENGMFSTASDWNSHESKTNANDDAVTWYEDGTYEVDEDALDAYAGIWFCGYADGDEAGTYVGADDDLGALPYDTYTLTELRTSANEGTALIIVTVTISRDGCEVYYGTLYDDTISFSTELTYGGMHVAPATEAVILTDSIATEGISTDETYVLVGYVYDYDADGTLVGIVAQTEITTKLSGTGTATNSFVVDTTGMEGHTLVCAEYLYDTDGNLVAYHDDATDASQTVGIPTVATVATSAATGDDEAPAASGQTIVDTVELSGLVAGHTYTVTGELHLVTYDDEGNAVDGGAIATATTYVTATESAASCEVRFTDVDLTDYQGCDLVAFEYLTIGDVIYASHADITDEDQTVHVPSVHTTAMGIVSDDEISNDSTVTVLCYEDGWYTADDLLAYLGEGYGLSYMEAGTSVTSESSVTYYDVDTWELTDEDGTVVCTFSGDEVATVSSDAYEAGMSELPSDDESSDGESSEDESTEDESVEDETSDDAEDESADDDSSETETTEDESSEDETSDDAEDESADDDSSETETTEDESSEDETSDDVTTDDETPDDAEDESADDDSSETETTEDESVTADVYSEAAASYTGSGSHVIPSAGEQVVFDLVEFENLTVGKTYVVTGTLHLKAYDEEGNVIDGGVVTDADGNEVTDSVEFVATATEMSVALAFVVDADALAGSAIVAFESVTSDGIEVMTHADITDEDQTVGFPAVETMAASDATGDSESPAYDGQTVTDTISLTGLVEGETYTVSGTLHIVSYDEDGNATDGGAISEAVTQEVTATAESMTVTMTFAFDASGYTGSDVVVFEELWYDGALVADHSDITDDNQTISVPDVHTTATSETTGTHEVPAIGTQTVTDEVVLENLTVGKTYVVTGTLHLKAYDSEGNVVDGGTLTDADGNEVTSSVELTATSEDMTVTLTFEVDAESLAGSTLVAFEDVTSGGVGIMTHADITDEDQTVHIPKVATSATDGADGDSEVAADTDQTVIDTVSYENLTAGTEYTLTGELHLVSYDDATDEGIVSTSVVTFTPEATSGTVEVTFTVDASGLDGNDLVVFEYLYLSDTLVASHEDVTDEAQTVHVPAIQTVLMTCDGLHTWQVGTEITTASTISLLVWWDDQWMIEEVLYSTYGLLLDYEDGTYTLTTDEGVSTILPTSYVRIIEETEIDDETEADTTTTDADNEILTLVDYVIYENLTVGATYTVTGTLHLVSYDSDGNATDGGEYTDASGNVVTSSATFTATSTSGVAQVTFEVGTSDLEAGTTLVAFEQLANESGTNVATHKDASDENQSVHVIDIQTTATDGDDGDKEVEADTSATVVDEIAYTNLVVGETYTVVGTLHYVTYDDEGNATDGGELFDADGNAVTASATFTALSSDGTVDVTFTFDASDLEGQLLVAYERLYDASGIVVAFHEDASDESQTVIISTPSEDYPQTGLWPICLALAGTGALALCASKMRAWRRGRKA